QTDVTPTVNTPQNIQSLKTLDLVLAQQQGNVADLPAAVRANQIDGTEQQRAAAEAASKLLGTPDVVIKESPVDAENGNDNTGNGRGRGNSGNRGNSRNRGGNNNQKRGEAGQALRWARRYVVPGAEFQPEVAP
ncbi:hypothetical protein CH063_09131, partial [Colletotrichum higginsianum]